MSKANLIISVINELNEKLKQDSNKIIADYNVFDKAYTITAYIDNNIIEVKWSRIIEGLTVQINDNQRCDINRCFEKYRLPKYKFFKLYNRIKNQTKDEATLAFAKKIDDIFSTADKQILGK